MAETTERAVSSHPLESHPEYVGAIGMVSLEAIALEIRLSQLLARMLSIPIRVAQAIYLTPKAEQTRIDIFRNAAHATLSVPPSKKDSWLGKQQTHALKRVNSLLNRAESLIRERHRVIHDEWNYSDTEKKVTRRLIDGRTGRERVPVSDKTLADLIYNMRLLIDDVFDLSQAFHKHPPTMAELRRDALPETYKIAPQRQQAKARQ